MTLYFRKKNQFSNKLGLPITSRILSKAQGEFRFNDIKQLMRNGCDVELILVMLDVDTNSPLGLGHAVTLSGFVDKGAEDKRFIIHDPGTRNTVNDIHRLNESAAGGLTFPYVFEGRTRRALVDLILVECCTGPMPTSTPGISPTPIPAPTPEPTVEPNTIPRLEPTPERTPAPKENCCEFDPPQGCASGPTLPFEECIELPGFRGFFPGHTCDEKIGNCVQ